jgi:DNA-binding winged helix-turn-helix (wHTH) protein
MSMKPGQIVREGLPNAAFEPFRHPEMCERRIVSGGNADIPVPKLSFDLLLVLVRAAPNVVSIDEFMERVWPGLVVSPETVSQRVKLLREVTDTG